MYPCDVPMFAVLRRPGSGAGVSSLGRFLSGGDGLENGPRASTWPDRRTPCREQVPLWPHGPRPGAARPTGGGQAHLSSPHVRAAPQFPSSSLGMGPALVSATSLHVLGESLVGFVFFRWLECIHLGSEGEKEPSSFILFLHSLRHHSRALISSRFLLSPPPTPGLFVRWFSTRTHMHHF